MTNFTKANLETDGDYTFFHPKGLYSTPRAEQVFVCRFKYSKKDRPSFIRFLIANVTVEEFIARMDAGEGPQPILESHGYIAPSVAAYRAKRAA